MSQAFETLLRSWDSGLLSNLNQELIHTRIPLTLVQAMVTTLRTQSLDGSWGLRRPSREITAYAILTLKALVIIPWLMHFADVIQLAIDRASEYLISTREQWGIEDYIWIGKTTYVLPTVSWAYCLAALCANKSYTWSERIRGLAVLPSKKITKLSKFFANLPIFFNDERWMLEAAVAEGFFWQQQLVRIRSDIFPYDDLTRYKYFEYIPFTWIATNHRNGSPLSNKALWELMSMALLLYQLDEFMESAVCSQEQLKGIESVKVLVKRLCKGPRQDEAESPENRYTITSDDSGNVEVSFKDVFTWRPAAEKAPLKTSEERDNELGQEEVINGPPLPVTDIESTLTRFISHILTHRAVVQSPHHIRLYLHQSLERYILAHIAHEEANARFASEQHSTNGLHDSLDSQDLPTIKTFPALQLDYYTWTIAISARDIGCSFAYHLFTLLALPDPSQPFFQGAKQHWYSARVDHHLAVMCRQYNDCGSLARDAAEGNINSLNFAEFHEGPGGRDEAAMKAELLAIADFERESVGRAMRKLEGELQGTGNGAWKMDALRVMVDTADLFGQMYVARDISPRVK